MIHQQAQKNCVPEPQDVNCKSYNYFHHCVEEISTVLHKKAQFILYFKITDIKFQFIKTETKIPDMFLKSNNFF